MIFFFFQAEDGIRDIDVTGVQTCALPIWFRRHVGPFAGVQIDSRETFFVLRDVVHEVDARGRTELELLGAEPHRWWSAAEVADSDEPFAPRELADLLPELSAGPWTGPPRFVG